MEEQQEKTEIANVTNEPVKEAQTPAKYKFYTKKIERPLMIIFLLLFLITFDQNLTTPILIIFYTASILCILYYFILFRKKTAYVIVEKDCITIARGISLKDEEIKNDSIKKVNVLDKKIEILFSKEGVEDKVSIYNILLESNDRNSFKAHLLSITK